MLLQIAQSDKFKFAQVKSLIIFSIIPQSTFFFLHEYEEKEKLRLHDVYNGWEVETNDEIDNDGNDVHTIKIKSFSTFQWTKGIYFNIVSLSLLMMEENQYT